MRTLCEIVAQDMMPSIRAIVSRELICTYNLSQTETAKLLGVSQPAVSQYLRQLRGEKAKAMENGIVHKEIKELCGRLSANELSKAELMHEFCRICSIAIDNDVIKVSKELRSIRCAVCNGH